MALSPEADIPDLENPEIEPLRTYKIDYEKGEITNEIINGLEAIKQFVYMALQTPRYVHPIYSTDYGSEIADLISDKEVTEEFKKMELQRLITEALIYDERITDVAEFNIERVNDSFRVSFKVHSDEGILDVEEVFE